MDGKQERRRPAAWSRGPFFPLAVLFLLYAASIFIAAGTSLFPGEPKSSPLWNDTTISFSIGGPFPLRDGLPDWAVALLVGVILSTPGQKAMLVAWAIYTSGRWPLRVAVALIAMIILDAIMDVSLSLRVEDWKGAIDPFLLLPLIFLSLAAPLAAFALLSGRRLAYSKSAQPTATSGKHFSIADILWITAAVAASLALAQFRNIDADHAIALIFLLIYAVVHVLPVLYCALAIRRTWLALCSTLSIAGAFSVPFVMVMIADGKWAMQAGTAIGLVWTVPGSVLIWRSCGYQLVRPSIQLADDLGGSTRTI